MKKYIGTKMLEATPMTRGSYNLYRGWEIPSDENPLDEGYMVKYSDGYVSWSPKKQFDETYRECMGLTFGIALELLKQGVKLARDGWNGKSVFVVYQKGFSAETPCNKQTAEAWGLQGGDLFKCNPYLQIQNVDGSHFMWTPSIGDILAEDWVIVE